MSSRIIHWALLTVGLAASGCAIEAGSAGPLEPDDTLIPELGSPQDDEVTQPSTSASGETMGTGGPADPRGGTYQSNDPGKPSPDPWRSPKTGNTAEAWKPGWVDPRLAPSQL